jgi:predicted MFS family arabinose efflux permease
VALAVFAFGFSISLWNVTHVSLRQQLVPNELRGRVAASNRLITWGSLPTGAALGGAVATLYGLHAPVLLAAILLAFATLVACVKVTPSAIASAQQRAEAPALA